MTDTVTISCPNCGADMEVSMWEEQHKRDTGIGMQTVGWDRFMEPTNVNCDCEVDPDRIEERVNRVLSRQNR